jgi:inner membrane protein involved in colicin E2 resistance
MTDEELLAESKALKSFSIMNAFLIGFLAGIVLFSIFYSAFGLLMLIPLSMIYVFVNDPRAKRAKTVERLVQERGLQR